MSTTIDSIPALEALFGAVSEPSRRKQVDHIAAPYAAMVAASPFYVMCTAGPQGLDASPRGDPAGFVRVVDPKTLHLPERRGNNRIDSLRNLVADPRIGLLFLIPGVGETLRINGRARISVEPALLASFERDGKPPKCVVEVAVEEVFFQCARAIARSKLWEPLPAEVLATVPSAGQVLAALTAGDLGGDLYDRELPGRQKATLY